MLIIRRPGEFIPENGGGAGIRFRERKVAKPDEGLRPDQLTSENDGGQG
jgi:hypothetical protein